MDFTRRGFGGPFVSIFVEVGMDILDIIDGRTYRIKIALGATA